MSISSRTRDEGHVLVPFLYGKCTLSTKTLFQCMDFLNWGWSKWMLSMNTVHIACGMRGGLWSSVSMYSETYRCHILTCIGKNKWNFTYCKIQWCPPQIPGNKCTIYHLHHFDCTLNGSRKMQNLSMMFLPEVLNEERQNVIVLVHFSISLRAKLCNVQNATPNTSTFQNPKPGNRFCRITETVNDLLIISGLLSINLYSQSTLRKNSFRILAHG